MCRVASVQVPPAVENSLDPWLSDYDALTASIRAGSRGFEAGLDEIATGFALMRTERLGGAVLDAAGRVLHANARFLGTGGVHALAPGQAPAASKRGIRIDFRISFPSGFSCRRRSAWVRDSTSDPDSRSPTVQRRLPGRGFEWATTSRSLANGSVPRRRSGRAQAQVFVRAAGCFVVNLGRYGRGEPLEPLVDYARGY